MLTKSEKAKLFSFIVGTISFTAVLVGFVVCKHLPSALGVAD